jgi:hypothetical protein
MANPTNKLRVVLLASVAVSVLAFAPAFAQDYYNQPYYNDASRSDFIALDAGDSSQTNIILQADTPTPRRINDTHIHSNGTAGMAIYEEFLRRHAKPAQAPITLNFNTGGGGG